MSHWAPDYCFEQLKKYQKLIAAAAGTNEANTRLRSIDTMLFKVLGWDELDVDVEKYVRAVGYADYAMHVGGGLAMIVEAKKADESFAIPDVEFPSGSCGFGLLAKECPEADKALRQAIGYAASLGVRYVGITNGHQWLVALTYVPNQTVDERQVIVFESLDAVEKRFRLYWDCFSPRGIDKNQAMNLLHDTRKAPPPPKLSQRLSVYPAPANRNAIAGELSVILGAVWEEVTQAEVEVEFLKNCYVVPKASTPSLALAKELIEQKVSSDERVFTKAIQPGEVTNLLKEYSPEKPIVVVGKVGNGKTTFLNYLRKIEAVDSLSKYIQIDIDFIDRPAHASEVSQFIYSRIEEQLKEPPYSLDVMDDTLIRAAMHADINRFKKSPEGKAYQPGSPEYIEEELAFINSIRAEKHEFYKRVFIHLRGSRRFSLAIFIDNLDRRSEPIQEEAYLRASAIARDWASLVFVCLRPTTFYKSSKLGVLDSVAPKLVNITSARSDHVLVRRLKYAKRYAEGSTPPERSNRAPLGSSFSFEMPNVATALECLIESFRHRKQLVDLFEAAANGNTRELLKYTYQFLTSKFLDTREIIDKFRENRTYKVPVHHALRALLYGDSLHYDPKTCTFANLFDIQQANELEHYTRLTLLHYLSTLPDGHPTYGFARITDAVSHLCKVGYTSSHAQWTVHYLFERSCVESRDPIETWSDEVREIRLSPLGRYHITDLITHFAYFDAVTVDTPILDPSARASTTDVFPIRQRIVRCIAFMEYLDNASNNILDLPVKRLWEDTFKNIMEQMGKINDRLEEQDDELL